MKGRTYGREGYPWGMSQRGPHLGKAQASWNCQGACLANVQWARVWEPSGRVWECGLKRRSNQSILKEINPEHSLEGLMLKLKLQYFGHLMRRANSLKKTLFLGKIEGRRRRGRPRLRCLDGITYTMSFSKLSRQWRTTGSPGVLQPWGHTESETSEQLKNKKGELPCQGLNAQSRQS